nr:hypothetical protein Iba_chr02eCG6340 [Ipomoea batatas]
MRLAAAVPPLYPASFTSRRKECGTGSRNRHHRRLPPQDLTPSSEATRKQRGEKNGRRAGVDPYCCCIALARTRDRRRYHPSHHAKASYVAESSSSELAHRPPPRNVVEDQEKKPVPPELAMFAVDAPLHCRRLREAREKRESRRLSCCGEGKEARRCSSTAIPYFLYVEEEGMRHGFTESSSPQSATARSNAVVRSHQKTGRGKSRRTPPPRPHRRTYHCVGRESLLSLLFRVQRTGEELVSIPTAAASRLPERVTAAATISHTMPRRRTSRRARLQNSPTGRHHATSSKIRRRSLSPPELAMFAVDAPLHCQRLREAREKRESRRLSCCG